MIKPIGSNQNELVLSNGVKVLYSYSTPVAAYVPERGYLKTSTFYSVTTSKHINKWLPDNTIVSIISQEEIDKFVKG